MTLISARPVVFCTSCEEQRGARPNVDNSSINKNFTDFRQSYRNKPYECQKVLLEVQLSSFLFSLVPSKKLSAATAEDIVKFLISKDLAGKQKLHLPSTLERSVIAQSLGQSLIS